MKRQIVEISCDVCGESTGKASEHTFTIDSVSYKIDLCDLHSGELSGAIAPFVVAGTRQGRPGRPRAVSPRASRKSAAPDLKAVRSWAAANGLGTSTRGRLPRAVLEAYEAAGSPTAESTVAVAAPARTRTARSGARRSPGRPRGSKKAAS
jgi:hypothetical protein